MPNGQIAQHVEQVFDVLYRLCRRLQWRLVAEVGRNQVMHRRAVRPLGLKCVYGGKVNIFTDITPRPAGVSANAGDQSSPVDGTTAIGRAV